MKFLNVNLMVINWTTLNTIRLSKHTRTRMFKNHIFETWIASLNDKNTTVLDVFRVLW